MMTRIEIPKTRAPGYPDLPEGMTSEEAEILFGDLGSHMRASYDTAFPPPNFDEWRKHREKLRSTLQ